MVRHVVLMKLVDRADAAEARTRLEALAPVVPQLRSLSVGIDVLGTEASYDLSLVTTHDSLEDLAAYQEHPEHQDFLAWARPRLAARAVVDSED